MSDEADLADLHIQKVIDYGRKALGKLQIPENESGVCWNCGESVADKRRWCSATCREDWEKIHAL